MKLTFLGAAGTVTGSKYLLEHDGRKVLVDCGLFQGYKHLRELNWEDLPFDPGKLDGVVLTHAHLDHSGALPLLVRRGFRGPILATQGTIDLCQLLLTDSGRLQEEEAEYSNRHESSKHRPALALVEREGACLSWGGGLALSPADDLLIRVERPLDLDGDAQLVASVLSKKIAAGATHVVLDIPIGPTAKIRNEADASRLTALLSQVGDACGLKLHIRHTRGSQPVGRGIGPALEAHDVMAVLRGAAHAPLDLRSRALNLAGDLLEFCGKAQPGAGHSLAHRILDSGMAWQKFQGICEAQGGMHEPGLATFREPVLAERGGHVAHIDNRRLSRLAKLLGAPTTPTAGLEMQVELGTHVQKGQPHAPVHSPLALTASPSTHRKRRDGFRPKITEM